MTQAAQLAQYGANNVGLSFKNRIINGDMGIDQRNNGAAVTLSNVNQFPVDRFVAARDTSGATCTAQRSTVVPPNFTNSLLWTTTTGSSPAAGNDNIMYQYIEGFNVSDFGWGTANAQAFTLSFWTRSSLTGTYGVSLANADTSRCLMATYTISAANTWEYKTITVAGDTAGTWVTNNGIGLRIFWDMGSGSSRSIAASSSWGSSFGTGLTGGVKIVGTTGATFYITGVQLEKGTVATSFDYLPYGTELALCQRYFEILMTSSSGDANRPAAVAATTSDIYFNILYKVNKRTTSPTVTFGAGEIFTGLWNAFTSPTVTGANDISAQFTGIRAGLTQNAAYLVRNASITVSAEL